MRKDIKFIHTADIHLGGILHTGSNLPQYLEDISKKATLESFKNTCDLALEEEIDFMLIAGDVYDQEARSVRANDFFNKQCQRLNEKNIPVYIIAGNHDPLGKNSFPLSLPDNVHVFRSEEAEIIGAKDDEGNIIANIIGQSYQRNAESRKMYKSYQFEDKSTWNIGLLHTQLDASNKNYVPCSKKDLLNISSVDYWALGHIHKPDIVYKNDNRVIAFSGCPQGRDVNESGLRGVLMVELTELKEAKISLVPVSPVVWDKIDFNINNSISNITDLKKELINQIKNKTGIFNLSQDISVIDDYLNEFLKGVILSIKLKGRGEIHSMLEEQGEEALVYLKEDLCESLQKQNPFIWIDNIVDHTGSALPDIEELIKNNRVLSDINEIAESCKTDDDLRSEIMDSFGSVWYENQGSIRKNHHKFNLDDEKIEEIIEQAKQLIFEKLLTGGG